MAITDIPILSMLRMRLDWSQARQRILAENVANADTPQFQARDLAQPKFEELARKATFPVALARTDSGHIGAAGTHGSPFRINPTEKYAVRPTGNSVSLEQEMMKMAANQMDYQAATTLYSRSLNLIKTALGKR